MAIGPDGRFDYVAEFARTGFKLGEIVAQARSRAESEAALVGNSPRVRFWNERLVLIAADSPRAPLRWASFPVGDAVAFAAQSGDTLSLVCTHTGDLGLSVVRDGELVLALGAIAQVQLGTNIKASNKFADGEGPAWLEVCSGIDTSSLRHQESARVGRYDVYVERTCTCHLDPDGVAECAAIVRSGDVKATNAAMRSAILLGQESLDALQGEDWDGHYIRR